MKTLRLFVASLLICGSISAATPSTINNDDSCDVNVGPAATLLLPYFEVETNPNPAVKAQTTLFTITNVTRYPQIAHVTLWTDLAFPVLTFNLYLTGYDVQAINLADVIVRGAIAPPNGTTSATTPGALSTSSNPNHRSPLDCGNTPALLTPTLTNAVKSALTTGVYNPGGGVKACSTAGLVHANAIGYATIDVVASCTDRTPLDPLYYTTDLLFDNVLIGDYQRIGAAPAGTGAASVYDAAGNPMVHIRAVPEGGGAGSNVGTSLPYTFYDRYTPAARRTFDRRQPLPSTFAARYIQGGVGAFATNITIWREGFVGGEASCASYYNNSGMAYGEFVRFDEHENSYGLGIEACVGGCIVPISNLPATSRTSTTSSGFPVLTGTDVGGWFYLNLSSGAREGGYSDGTCRAVLSAQRAGFGTCNDTAVGNSGSRTTSQNWVITSMFGAAGTNRVSVDFDAAALGNGCTPEKPAGATIGPASHPGGSLLCPNNAKPANCSAATRPPGVNP